MAWGEAPSTEVLFENLENSETSEDVRKQTRALLNEARLQIKEFHNAWADDLHKAAVERYNTAVENLEADIKSDNEQTSWELEKFKELLSNSTKEKQWESENSEATKALTNKAELLYTLDVDSLLQIFSNMKEGKVNLPKGLRLSDIAPELRWQSEVILNFPWSFNWTDILLIPERVLRRNTILTSLLLRQINNTLTINRLLYRSLNVMPPEDVYKEFVKVFSSPEVNEDQRKALWSRIPPVISKQDSTWVFTKYLAENQDTFFEWMQHIDKVLTSEGSDALKNNEDYWLLAKQTIEKGDFGKTENLKYVIYKYPQLAKLAIKKDPNNIMFLPTELRSDMVIMTAWIDAIPDSKKSLLNKIHLLVFEESYKLREVFEKIIAKFWNNDISSESVQELIKMQPKFEHIIRGRLEKTSDSETNSTLKLLYSTTIDYQLSKAMDKNKEIKWESDDQQYYWDVRSVISQSINATSPSAKELAEANIDKLVDIFQSYEENSTASKHLAITSLINIFWPEDAKIFLREFANSMIQKKEIERNIQLQEDNTPLEEIKDPKIRELLSMNIDFQKMIFDSQKIDNFIQSFITKKYTEGTTNLQEINKSLFRSIDDYDLTKEQKDSLRAAFEFSLDKAKYELDRQKSDTLIDSVNSWKDLEEVYDEIFIKSVASWEVFQTNQVNNIGEDTPNNSEPLNNLWDNKIESTIHLSNGKYIYKHDGESIPISPEEKNMLDSNPKAADNIVNMYEFFKELNLLWVWEYRKDLVNAVWEVHINLEDDSLDEAELLQFGKKILKIIENIQLTEQEQTWKQWSIVNPNITSLDSLNKELSKFSGSRDLWGDDKSFNNYGEGRFEAWMRNYGIIWGITFHTSKVREMMK